MRIQRAALAVFGLLLGGCASSPPSAFYTLTPMVADRDAAVSQTAPIVGGRLAIGLGPVSFPRFLDRPQVVQREGANQLAIDEFHRWGGSLDDDFLRVWAENLARLLDTSRILVFPSELRLPLDFRVIAEVIAFEVDSAGQATLKTRWVVLDPNSGFSPGQVLSMREDLYRVSLPAAASVADQVGALSRALSAFSRDVAEVLVALPRTKPGPVDDSVPR